MTLDHIRIVLVRPQEPRNIGAVCRVMKNFGIRELVIVDPQGPAAADLRYGSETSSASQPDERAETARRLAVHAEDILDAARICTSVAEAVSDAGLVVGTSRRQGQKRKADAALPEDFAAAALRLAPAKVALLFGNERFGLSEDELMHASELVVIPSAPDCPSLNLSHAVGVICYVLSRAALESGELNSETGVSIREVISRDELTGLVGTIEQRLNAMGFYSQDGPQGMRAFLTDVLGRAGLAGNEAARLRKLFASLAGLHRTE